ncbi:hypothetical protein GCM10009716_02070 [Streptomyces sodiiphilus]|uniref:Uncharacterized protein n=1 Tax=Streptomyces sodiiphilus TaxID=226217 RepID=A0ABP5A0B0_9ACTN
MRDKTLGETRAGAADKGGGTRTGHPGTLAALPEGRRRVRLPGGDGCKRLHHCSQAASGDPCRPAPKLS